MKINFAGFDGMERTCVKFKKVKKGVFRCVKFAASTRVGKHPTDCPPGLTSRSPGLIRREDKVCGPGHPRYSSSLKLKVVKRKSRRSPSRKRRVTRRRSR